MPRDTKRKRRSCENLKKAREAQKKMKESSSTAATPSSSSTTESQAQRSHEDVTESVSDPSMLVSTQEDQLLAPSQSQSTPVDQPEISETPPQSHDDQPTPEATLENEPDTLELETDKTAVPRSPTEILADFCEDWLTELDRDDKKSLGIFLCYNLVKHFGMNNTEVSKINQLHTILMIIIWQLIPFVGCSIGCYYDWKVGSISSTVAYQCAKQRWHPTREQAGQISAEWSSLEQ